MPSFVWGLLLMAACGGGSEIGEEPAQDSDADDCVDGPSCAKAESGELQCMKV